MAIALKTPGNRAIFKVLNLFSYNSSENYLIINGLQISSKFVHFNQYVIQFAIKLSHKTRSLMTTTRDKDKAIADAITADLAQTPNTSRAIVETKQITLPSPFLVGKTDVEDINEHRIPGFDGVMLHELQDIILGKLDAEDKEAAALLTENVEYHYPHINFFSKNVAQMLAKAANDILEGSQASVDR